MKKGTQLIAEERKRQIEKEGYDAQHDYFHCDGGLAIAAACYALNKMPEGSQTEVHFVDTVGCSEAFPFEKEFDKREKHSRLKSLVIAGALIAAEIDRELGEATEEALNHDKSLFCQRNKTN